MLVHCLILHLLFTLLGHKCVRIVCNYTFLSGSKVKSSSYELFSVYYNV